MNPINFFKTRRTARRKEKKKVLRKFICLFFILVFLLNFLSIETKNNQNFVNEKDIIKNEVLEENQDSLKTQGISSILQDPYTENFSDMWLFFKNYFKSPYKFKSPQGDNIPLYVSESDNTGTITDDTIYSLDNLLLYKSLLQQSYDEYDTFDAYLDLKFTPLWYYYNSTQYGFVESIDGSTGEIINHDRTLISNLMPIFLLLENVGNEMNNINIKGDTPRNSIIDMVKLIDSSEFWDSTNEGFYEINSTTGDKDIKSNLYAVLANFMIYRYKGALRDDTLSESAKKKAKLTMWKLVNQTWDSMNEGFYYKSKEDWTPYTYPQSQNHKYLSVNALGILALLEHWIMTGMKSNSIYYNMSIDLFNRLNRDSNVGGGNGGLWNTNYEAYETYNAEDWVPLSGLPDDETIDLEANSLMMLACLKLFEVSGNFTYYDRAITLFESLRKYFYNTNINAYKISHGESANTNILLYSNLRLCDTFLKAFEIYNSTTIETSFSHTNHPNYIMNQNNLTLTSNFKFEKVLVYYESDQRQEKTITYDDIIGADIAYIFRYPNDTIIEIINDFFKNNVTTIEYEINSSLPFGDGYEINIYANWTYFGFAFASREFNVKSGLFIVWDSDQTTLKDSYYQGEQANFSIAVQSNYNYNLTLNVSLIGNEIIVHTPLPVNVSFINNSLTVIEFNFTIRDDTPTENITITFLFKANSTLYLKESTIIEIKNALTYSNLIYSKKVVAGNNVKLFVDLINQSPNVTQTFNLIFSGTFIGTINDSITLSESEIKRVSYLIGTDSIITTRSIEIDMSISVGKTPLNPEPETLVIEIVPILEIISIEFPEKTTQGTYAYLIIYIQNNQESSEEFTLFINDEKIDTEIDELSPGENRIEHKIVSTWNPYEIGTKVYLIEIEDSSGEVVYKDYFETEIQVSAIYLIVAYILPILAILGVILYYKSKEIKHKLLRR
ncbi:MAG: hypothetical protein ACFFBP_21360 [Promethearchaeota archaeon]